MEDSGKMHVQDLEKAQHDKEAKAKRRSKEGYGVDSDTDSGDDVAIAKKGSNSREMKNALKRHNLTQRNQSSSGIQKNKSMIQKSRHRAAAANATSGHIEKFSGDSYKSAKGKGDVIKAGKLEPFSYIQLNPRLLNKRHKQKAINSFTKVVNFGKKVDKRSDGMLKGMQVKG